jgi:GT2 family glycosyltransferase
MNCLQAVFNQNALRHEFNIEVFLVDDGSTDGTSVAIKAQFPMVNIIQGNGNLYWNRGMHLAWQTASKKSIFDFYLWLNDDTFLFNDSLNKLLEGAKKTKCLAAICGSTYSSKQQIITYGGHSYKGNLLLPNGSLQEAFTFNGNIVLIPKAVYEKIGNLDPVFHHSIGDYDYALRIRRHNLKSFILEDYAGECDKHEELPKWCLRNISFKQKVANLYSPLGNSHPIFYFYYTFKHFGFFVSFRHFVSIHIRLLFPGLWLKK